MTQQQYVNMWPNNKQGYTNQRMIEHENEIASDKWSNNIQGRAQEICHTLSHMRPGHSQTDNISWCIVAAIMHISNSGSIFICDD